VYTTCARDCWDACGIIAKKENNRIIELKGAPEHPVTRGFLCKKMQKGYLKRMYSPERILYPMIKTKEGWEKTTWDNALEIAAEKITFYIKKYGPLSIFFYPGFGNMGIVTRFTSQRFFNLLGGVTTVSGSLCDSAGEEGLHQSFGHYRSHHPEDLSNSRAVLIWGRNPAVTNIHFMPYINQARKKGAKLIVIDPVKTLTARKADLHLAPRPGKDAFLALGMACILKEQGLIDRSFIQEKTFGFDDFINFLDSFSVNKLSMLCGIDKNLMNRAALIYGTNKPASIWLGMGAQHYRTGAETYRLISALSALTGQIGIPGGGVSFEFPSSSHFDGDICASECAIQKRFIPRPVLGKELQRLQRETPPVKMAWVVAANPVNQSPNSLGVARAFQELEFVVVQDAFLTDTADCAHLFLPTTLFLETEDITAGFGHCWIGPVNRVVPPPGEAKSDLEIFQMLATRLGFGPDMEGEPRNWIDLSTRSLQKAGLSLNELLAGPCLDPRMPPVPFTDGNFPTPSGKYEFITDLSIFNRNTKIEKSIQKEHTKPLRLITPKSNSIILSEAVRDEQKVPPLININPCIAEKLSLEEGEEVSIRSRVGTLRGKVHLVPHHRTDVVSIEVGSWIKYGGGVNILTEDIMSYTGEGAGYYETIVSLEKIPTCL